MYTLQQNYKANLRLYNYIMLIIILWAAASTIPIHTINSKVCDKSGKLREQLFQVQEKYLPSTYDGNDGQREILPPLTTIPIKCFFRQTACAASAIRRLDCVKPASNEHSDGTWRTRLSVRSLSDSSRDYNNYYYCHHSARGMGIVLLSSVSRH